MLLYKEVQRHWEQHRRECGLYRDAIYSLYTSLLHPDIQVAVDQTPVILMSRSITLACLISMGRAEQSVRDKVIAKMVELRLAS